jgi:hypothetical protein
VWHEACGRADVLTFEQVSREECRVVSCCVREQWRADYVADRVNTWSRCLEAIRGNDESTLVSFYAGVIKFQL